MGDTRTSSLLYVLLDRADRAATWARGQEFFAEFIREVLGHARIPFQTLEKADLRRALSGRELLLVPYSTSFSSEEKRAVSDFVRAGGSLITLGGASGLEELLGVRRSISLAESYLDPAAADHVLTRDLVQPLHCLGGVAFEAGNGVALFPSRNQENLPLSASGVVVNRPGKGRTVAIGPDVLASLVRIQQGWPVFGDGEPAPDGTAPVNDGILKTDDGIALSWRYDRRLPPGSPPVPRPFPHGWPVQAVAPLFAEPIADALREVLLRAIFWCAMESELLLPWIWYWPGDVDAVAHLSFDSDHNLDESALTTLASLEPTGVRATWCILYPGGYRRETYDRIRERGHEIALHYNALSGDEHCQWGQEHLAYQHRWLKEAAGLDKIISNKNHYTRWEGWSDFYRWCETQGIQLDQTRGPSKQGDVGFPFGTCQPWFPLDDAAHRQRSLDVVAMPLLTQDLALTTEKENASLLLDAVHRHHGIAHFLFHPIHIHTKPDVRAAMLEVLALAREQGLPWWTAAEINAWERARRGVEIGVEEDGSGQVTLRITTAQAIDRVSILLPIPTRPGDEPPPPSDAGRSSIVSHHGFPFLRLTLNLPSGESKIPVVGPGDARWRPAALA